MFFFQTKTSAPAAALRIRLGRWPRPARRWKWPRRPGCRPCRAARWKPSWRRRFFGWTTRWTPKDTQFFTVWRKSWYKRASYSFFFWKKKTHVGWFYLDLWILWFIYVSIWIPKMSEHPAVGPAASGASGERLGRGGGTAEVPGLEQLGTAKFVAYVEGQKIWWRVMSDEYNCIINHDWTILKSAFCWDHSWPNHEVGSFWVVTRWAQFSPSQLRSLPSSKKVRGAKTCFSLRGQFQLFFFGDVLKKTHWHNNQIINNEL